MKHPSTPVTEGCPFDCGLCANHRQRTCTAVMEVTQRCNLKCTFCFASAGGREGDCSLTQIRNWYHSLLAAGGPCNVQISGGEPTLRNDLPDIVAMGRDLGFKFIQLNTNGLRLSHDLAFLRSLKEAGLDSLFLQFDGTDPEITRQLRGGDYLKDKMETVRRCGDLGIGVTLVPTVVRGINDHNLGDMVRFALEQLPIVRGIHFQPASYFGRIPHAPGDDDRITIPEVIAGIEEQTQGWMKADNFRPPGCENALCSFHGNFILMEDGTLVPTTRHEPATNCCNPVETAAEGAQQSIHFVATHWSAVEPEPTETPSPCGCTSSSDCGCNSGATVSPAAASSGVAGLQALDAFIDRARTHTLCISGMAFQDVWNIDLERLRDCCIHTVAPNGKLIPFCAYNLTDAAGNYLYRGQGRTTRVPVL